MITSFDFLVGRFRKQSWSLVLSGSLRKEYLFLGTALPLILHSLLFLILQEPLCLSQGVSIHIIITLSVISLEIIPFAKVSVSFLRTEEGIPIVCFGNPIQLEL